MVRLVWGEGLLSFKPEANLAGQISKVEVYGWDPKTKEAIVGRASAGEESGLERQERGRSTSTRSCVIPSKKPTLRLRQPVFTQAEADKRAKAALNERAKQFLTGEGETIGLPELRPDRNVAARQSRRAVLEDLLHPAGDAQDRQRAAIARASR